MPLMLSETRERRTQPRLSCPGLPALPPARRAGLCGAIGIPEVFAATVVDFSRHGLQTLCHKGDDGAADLYECALVDGTLRPSGLVGSWEMRRVWSLDMGACRWTGWFIAEPLRSAQTALLRFPPAHAVPLRCLLHPLKPWDGQAPGYPVSPAVRTMPTP